MPRYRAIISYDGSAYAGYQRQTGECLTVQGVLEDCFAEAFELPLVLHASGRTDAGVHARAQHAHFDVPFRLAPEQMRYAWNRQLPRDVRILDVQEAAPDFHARKSALGKRYSYYVYFGQRAPAIGHAYFCPWPYPCEPETITPALAALVGHHDFRGFCGEGSSVKTFDRRLDLARFESQGPWGIFVFLGEGFLRHMVRIMVGSALDIASGRRPKDSIGQALASGRRELAGQTAPASGLFLEEVYYDAADYAAALNHWESSSLCDLCLGQSFGKP